jgi:hypothetical protein
MALVIACVLLLCLPHISFFIRIMISSLTGFALWLAISWWFHHRKMLQLLSNGTTPFQAFDDYLTKRLTDWENDTLRRIVVGVILMIATVLFVFYEDGKQFLAISASLLVAFVLFSMIKSWNYYLDGILQHDVRRSHRDQETDIST